MLIPHTFVKESPIHGVGCFTKSDIPKDTLVWKFSDCFDLKINIENAYGLWKECLEYYGWREDGYQIFCLDNAKYINHSKDANLVLDKETGNLVAARDIKAGEELTENYREVYEEGNYLDIGG